MMDIRKMYTLPMLSSNLYQAPDFILKNLDIEIVLCGGDINNNKKQIILSFKNVLCYEHTAPEFTKQLLDSYDTVVEIIDSEWLEQMKAMNEKEFNFWRLHHYAVFLDEIGLYQFAAREFEAKENA